MGYQLFLVIINEDNETIIAYKIAFYTVHIHLYMSRLLRFYYSSSSINLVKTSREEVVGRWSITLIKGKILLAPIDST